MTKVSVVKEEKKFGTIISDIIKEHEAKTKASSRKIDKKGKSNLPYIMNTTNSPIVINTEKIIEDGRCKGSQEVVVIKKTFLKKLLPKNDNLFNAQLEQLYEKGMIEDCSSTKHMQLTAEEYEKEKIKINAKEKLIDKVIVDNTIKFDPNKDVISIDLDKEIAEPDVIDQNAKISDKEMMAILNGLEGGNDGLNEVIKEIVTKDGKKTTIYRQEPTNYFTIDPDKLKPYSKKSAVEALQENPVVNSCSLGQISDERLDVVVDTPFMRALDILVRDNIEFRSSDWYRKDAPNACYGCKEYSTIGVRIHRRGGHSIGSCLVLSRYFNKILFVSMSHDNAEATKTECKKLGIDTSKITFSSVNSNGNRGQNYDCVVVDCCSWQDLSKLKDFETSICEPMFRTDPINFLYVRVE